MAFNKISSLHTIASALFLLGCTCTSVDQTQAHEIDSGIELGATLQVDTDSPVQATLRVVPKVSFEAVVVETPNTLGDSKTPCNFGKVVEGQIYTCQISGDVPDQENGFIVIVTGTNTESAGQHNMSRKVFTIPNPKFDAKAQQKLDQEEKEAKRVTLKTKE